MQGKIINITRYCTDDGPGIRTTVFLKGCPLKCIWCHNPESQNMEIESYHTGELIGKVITAVEVFEEVKRDKIFYETSGGGVTISGGEPLFQPEFTAEILKLCKECGIHTAIETSGFAGELALMTVLKYCDLVLFDIKETNEANHLQYTNVPAEPILKNLKKINDIGIPFLLRLPMIPGLNDRDEHLLKVKELAKDMNWCQGMEIMPYHILGEYKDKQLGRQYLCTGIQEPSKLQVENWRKLILH